MVAVAWRQDEPACRLHQAFFCEPMAVERCTVAVVELREWQPWLDDAWGLLDASERQRVSQRRIPADREALALTYALHRLFVANAIAVPPASVSIGRDANGCPWLPGHELHGRALHTSLSHADGVAAFALCARGPVGVDIEAAFRAGELPGIAASVCHPSELQSLAGFPEPAYSRALLSLWVRKEALLKAEGIGLAREMNTFRASAGETFPLTGRTRDDTACSVRLAMLDIGERWTAAVATPGDAAVECRHLRPDVGRIADGRALQVS
ncbi:4'-phosphopantetheinyl transferase family protein [Lysobacter panacisoli]|nr:4'-phosphopantetheinyl transferase superfamily protein [Lysobacter panacisoli]